MPLRVAANRGGATSHCQKESCELFLGRHKGPMDGFAMVSTPPSRLTTFRSNGWQTAIDDSSARTRDRPSSLGGRRGRLAVELGDVETAAMLFLQ